MRFDSHSRNDARNAQLLIQNLLVRGVVDKVDASKKMQLLDISLEDGHKPTKVEHWERYGFTQHPKKDAEVLAIAMGGNRDHLLVIDVADRRFRVKDLKEGELAVYDDQGQVVHFKREGIHVESSKGITLKSSAGITLETPTVTIKGNIEQEGSISSTGNHHAGGGHD